MVIITPTFWSFVISPEPKYIKNPAELLVQGFAPLYSPHSLERGCSLSNSLACTIQLSLQKILPYNELSRPALFADKEGQALPKAMHWVRGRTRVLKEVFRLQFIWAIGSSLFTVTVSTFFFFNHTEFLVKSFYRQDTSPTYVSVLFIIFIKYICVLFYY